ncbi:MAG: IreB family regulatory phosphoprotein [Bacillota bacterium]
MNDNDFDKTMMFKVDKEDESKVSRVLKEVYQALEEKGYNPVDQIVGYILSGDPTYITSHEGARSKIRQFERDEMIEELVKNYLGK